MTTKEIYDLAVKMGMKADLRGEKKVKNNLDRINKKYKSLNKEQKAEFDKERLTNPYSDTRILVDNKKKEIKKVFAGIDMGGPEILLAYLEGDVDAIVTHHPQGPCLADLSDVMHLQAQVLADYGVPINIAESVIKPRISEVARGTSPINHYRDIDIAKHLKMDMCNVHTPADNLGARYLVDLFNKKKCEYVEDIMKVLKEIPEYAEAVNRKAGPKLFVGSPENSCGKIAVTEFTGGTSGSKDIYEKMANAGIGTIIGMHIGEEHRKEAEKYHINVVIAGHIASDSLGMNLFLDELEKKGIEVVPVSGLIRVKRFKTKK